MIFIFLVTVTRQNKHCGHFRKNRDLGQTELQTEPKIGGYIFLVGYSTKTI